MKIVYLSNSIGKKSNGGSSLSGLRFLELLEHKFGHITLVTDEWRSPPYSTPLRTVELVATDLVRHGWSLKQIAKVFIVTAVNFTRKKRIEIDAENEDVLLIANSFTTLVEKIEIKTRGKVTKVCVVRGDTSSFLYQPWGEEQDHLARPKQFLNYFDAIIYVSKTILNNWIANGINIPYWYLPNAIDEIEVVRVKAWTVADMRIRLGMNSDNLQIVVVGSIQERKGQDLFATIANKLFTINPKVEVHFVGVVSAPSGGDRIVQTLKNTGRGCYIIHGHKDTPLEYVHAADIVVSTSRSEAFPRTVAEYMAMGRSVISTRVAGADEMIEHGRNGWLIGIDDSDGLLEGIRMLANNAEIRTSFGKEAEATYQRLYSSVRQQERFEEIFDQIITS